MRCSLLLTFLLVAACSRVAPPTAPAPVAGTSVPTSPGAEAAAAGDAPAHADTSVSGFRSPVAEERSGGAVAEGPATMRSSRSVEADAVLPTRALWVVRYTLTDPDSVRAMVQRADEAGFNTLLVQVRGRGDAFYRSRWEPRSENLAETAVEFDPLLLVLQEAHARGIQVHAWLNTFLVSGSEALPSSPRHLVNAGPELLAVPRELAPRLFRMDPEDPAYVEALREFAEQNRNRIEGLYVSPAHPEVKEHLYSVWTDLVERYPLDGVHFDYIRYPGPDFDYSRATLERFRNWIIPSLEPATLQSLEVRYENDPLTYADAFPEAWEHFRRQQIDDVLERVRLGVKSRSPGTLVSAAVLADSAAALERGQNWIGWLEGGMLDAVAPMAYTRDDTLFADQILRALVAATGRAGVWAGVGAFQNSFEGTLAQIEISIALGVEGVALFSYDWAVAESTGVAGGSFLRRLGEEAWLKHPP